MSAQTDAVTDVNCGRCGVTSDECYSLRDDCCMGCTHYPVLDPAEDVDRVAVERAVGGDKSVRLTRAETTEAWRCLEDKGIQRPTIADILGTTTRTVQRWADGVRAPTSRPPGGWTMEHNVNGNMTTTEGATDALLRRAAASESKRIRNAAERVGDALDRLREAFAEDEGKRAARERVAKLEEELRAAKAALRGGSSVPAKRKASTGEPVLCGKGCGKTFRDRRGIAVHEKGCVVTGNKAAV